MQTQRRLVAGGGRNEERLPADDGTIPELDGGDGRTTF